MAYQAHNLSVLAYANGFTLWHYGTTDTADEVDTTGYFNTAVEMLRVGDMIMANCDALKPSAGIFLVARSSAGVVDVRSMARTPEEAA